jgi:hypothetical protein
MTASHNPGAPSKIKFHFIKANYFRAVHADGAFGGITPQGHVQMAVYSERRPIPLEITNTFDGNQVGPEILEERVSKEGIVRELEVDLIMTVEVARSMQHWLEEQIAKWDELTSIKAQK